MECHARGIDALDPIDSPHKWTNFLYDQQSVGGTRRDKSPDASPSVPEMGNLKKTCKYRGKYESTEDMNRRPHIAELEVLSSCSQFVHVLVGHIYA